MTVNVKIYTTPVPDDMELVGALAGDMATNPNDALKNLRSALDRYDTTSGHMVFDVKFHGTGSLYAYGTVVRPKRNRN